MKPHTFQYFNQTFVGVKVTGNLISAEKIEQIASARLDQTTNKSYNCHENTNLRDKIAVSYRIGQQLWKNYLSLKQPNFAESREFVIKLLQNLFEYDQIEIPTAPILIESHSYNITLEGNNKCIPIVVAPPSQEKNKDSFDIAYREFGDSTGSRTKRRPDTLLQDYLNANSDTLWGIAVAGECVRLMRKNASLTRPTFIEFDLKVIFENSAFSDFTTMWLMLHSSRLNKTIDSRNDCWLEKWRREGIEAGTVIRGRLRGNFEKALLAFGNGFLHDNPEIVLRLDENKLSLEKYLEQLIRLVYRLIFVAVTEERNFILNPSTVTSVRRLYSKNYGFNQLREKALKRSLRNQNLDIWEGVRILLYSLDNGENKLGIPPLGGLFDQKLTPDLNNAVLSNKFLMEGIYHLSFIEDRNTRTRINWRDMQTEELGSVYEGLLELNPVRLDHGKTLSFANSQMAYGSKRRSAGAYYTPDVLVQALLDSSLDPQLNLAESKGGIDELLNLTVIDPACGSGHFLLGAARRIADRVTKLRDAEILDYQQSLREVIRRCIFGVDADPLTVELAKVGLWIEAVEPGKPLGYLDTNIKCGDSTVGILNLETLAKGIPDEAYDSDQKESSNFLKFYKQKNRSERERQGVLDFEKGEGIIANPPNIVKKLETIRNLPENTKEQKDTRELAYVKYRNDPELTKWKNASDVYLSPFVLSKVIETSCSIPTTLDVWKALDERDQDTNSITTIVKKTINLLNAFHWPLEFPNIFANGGFDVVIGNPPWEKLTLIEREFFYAYPEIEKEANSKIRKKLIRKMFQDEPEIELSWKHQKNLIKAKRDIIRFSKRFPLSAIGELNLYSLFTELSLGITNSKSYIGLILKSTIFTGFTCSKLTSYLIKSGKLESVYDFRNVNFFRDVAPIEKFSLTTIGPSKPKTNITIGIGLTNAVSLSKNNQVTKIDRIFPESVNPDTGTLPQCETIEDLQILKKASNLYSTLRQSNWKVRYSSGLHMTMRADELQNRESLEKLGYKLISNQFFTDNKRFIPLNEGKSIYQYDHRFGSFDTIPTNKRYGIRATPRQPDVSEKQDKGFEILPRYWVSEEYHSSDILKRKLKFSWNFAFKDVTNVMTNSRTAIGCIVGKVTCSSSLPNIVINAGCPKETALFLSMFNSVPYDYLLRQKFYGVHLNKSLLMQSVVVNREALMPYEGDIINRVGRLTGTSTSVDAFVNDLGIRIPGKYCVETRIQDKAWLDALYFKLFGFTLEEINYIFGTFPIWKKKSFNQWGKFYEQELTVEYFKNAS